MSIMESLEMKKKIQELLNKVIIHPSTFPCGSPTVFVPNKEWTWCMCIDFCALNKITVNIRYPIPHIDDFLDQLKYIRYFTKLYLRSGYH